MSKKSLVLAVVFVILAMEVCVGHSFSMEENTEGSDIVVVACQTKQDCLKNIRALPCGASVVKCSDGYCVCNH
ncbi:hypothetical protein PHAVU_003G018900 [Phaseolus vulgaris]|uniref:Uncharacterized protein n=1 Tax=Phaseolus vulgaris TaxID=3885 RepID=V7C4Z8_PHAVU|nr:hypothetical protein PHAVU_003G018900g [Phaseolus vulgaris]ESW25237.1 hypothetical protein PHAVU_003G018900g [Phaseolus vulgaris]